MMRMTGWSCGLGMLALLLGGCATTSHRVSDSPATGFITRSVEVDGKECPYVIYVPKGYTGSEAWPLIVFLHGYGERGDDGVAVLPGGVERVVEDADALAGGHALDDEALALDAREAFELAGLDQTFDAAIAREGRTRVGVGQLDRDVEAAIVEQETVDVDGAPEEARPGRGLRALARGALALEAHRTRDGRGQQLE